MKAARIFLVCIVLLAIVVPLYGYLSLCAPHLGRWVC